MASGGAASPGRRGARTSTRRSAAEPATRRTKRERPVAGRLERILADQGYRLVAGTDEVGRGALAGPLVTAAVLFDVHDVPDGMCDSKLLTPEEREACAARVYVSAVAVSWCVVDPADIDDEGLHVSNLAALSTAVKRLCPRPDYVISDHFTLDGVDVPQIGLPKADTTSAAVAAASVVAKVRRDAFMAELDGAYPGYGFARHKGYSCEEHWAAIRALGPSPVHRRSFRGVGAWQPSLDDLGDHRGGP